MSQLPVTLARRPWLRRIALVAVVVVPLAFVGLLSAAVSQSDDSAGIPAAVVNNDDMVTTIAEDGTEQMVLAGRQLVTELTGDDSSGFDWTITNEEDAEEALAAGEVYAIVTVPSNFSSSIVSVSGDDPQRARLSIRTDDSHNYLAAALNTAVAALAAEPENPARLATVQALTDRLQQAAASGPAVVGGVNTTFDRLAAGAGESAAGAEQLAAGGGELEQGARGLASGLSQLETGTSDAAAGAGAIAEGAGELATGLESGAEEVPQRTGDELDTASEIAADPVGLQVIRDNEVTDIRQMISTLFVPIGLWIGSLAVFLVLRPVTRRTLASSAASGRLVLSTFARAAALTAAQAALLVALLHVVLGVNWALLPASLLFSLVMALAFTAFHYLLTIGLGRAGLVVSLLLLAVQLTSTGGLYPIELLAAPFRVVSPFLPLTHGVLGMQAIIASSGEGTAILAALVLTAFGALSLLVSRFVLGRVRREAVLGEVPATA